MGEWTVERDVWAGLWAISQRNIRKHRASRKLSESMWWSWQQMWVSSPKNLGYIEAFYQVESLLNHIAGAEAKRSLSSSEAELNQRRLKIEAYFKPSLVNPFICGVQGETHAFQNQFPTHYNLPLKNQPNNSSDKMSFCRQSPPETYGFYGPLTFHSGNSTQ
jgi:hypothetical protein